MNTHQTDPIAHGISVETKPNAVPKAGADGKLDAGWLPESQPPVPAPHVITHEPGGADTLARLGPVTEQAQNLGTISGTVAVNLSLGLSISATIGGATNFLFSGVPTGGSAIVVMRLTNAGNHAITWPSIIWAGAGNPMFTANGRDLVAIITDNGGSLWWGCVTFEY